ncbi:unnamed protein product, partial [Musa banksii]
LVPGDDRPTFHPPTVEGVTREPLSRHQEGEGASHLLGRRHAYPLCVSNSYLR